MLRSVSLAVLGALLAFATPARAGDVLCPPHLGEVTVDDNVVVTGSCWLNRTTVDGNVFIEDRGSLTATNADIRGNIQSDGGRRAYVLRTRVDGNIQLKNLTDTQNSVVDRSHVKGSIQLDENRSPVLVVDNFVDGDVQAFKNRGAINIRTNAIDGNLQCKENLPAPRGFGNRVQGNKEDQCRRF